MFSLATKSQYETALESIIYNKQHIYTLDTTNWTIMDCLVTVILDQREPFLTITVAVANDAPGSAGGGNVLCLVRRFLPLLFVNALTLSDAESTAVNRVGVGAYGSGSGEQLNFSDTGKIEGSWLKGTPTCAIRQSPDKC